MQNLSGVTCGDPTPSIRDQFGEVVDYRPGPYYVGHNFTFSCPQGYNLLGSERRTCMNNGRWSGHNTICDPIGKFKLYDGERCASISSRFDTILGVSATLRYAFCFRLQNFQKFCSHNPIQACKMVL